MTNRITRVKPGDPTIQRASDFNAFADAADDLRYRRGLKPGNFRNALGQRDMVDVRAHAQISPYETLGFEGPAIAPADLPGGWLNQPRPAFASATLANRHLGQFGLGTTTTISAGGVVDAIGDGIATCRLFVPANGDWIEYADIDTSDSSQLLATPNGSAQILWKDAGTDATVDAIVRLGNKRYHQLVGKVTSNPEVVPDSTGAVDVWLNGANTSFNIPAVHLDWMHGNQAISFDKEVLIGWFPEEGLWRFVGAECEDPPPPVLGELSMDAVDFDQLVDANDPVRIEGFDASLSTANVTATPATAQLQLPDITEPEVYNTAFSAGLLVPSNNTVVRVSAYVNGVPFKTIGTVSAQNAANSQVISVPGSYLNLGVQSSPQVSYWVESSSAGTIKWTTLNASITKIGAGALS